jgi:hypothetical protein
LYCNCDRPVVEEVIYPPHADWKDIISIAEHCDQHTLNILTPKYIQFYVYHLGFLKFISKYAKSKIKQMVLIMLKLDNTEVVVFCVNIVTW